MTLHDYLSDLITDRFLFDKLDTAYGSRRNHLMRREELEEILTEVFRCGYAAALRDEKEATDED